MAVVDGGPVLPHVQAFADEVQLRFGITHIMTYVGHQPTRDRALDNFGTRQQMLDLAIWTTIDRVIDHYGVDYTMFDVNQTTVGSEIYNREISRSWRQVADRGSPTQNHHDHVHVSFDPTGPAVPISTPQEDDDMTPDQAKQLNDLHDLFFSPQGMAPDVPNGHDTFIELLRRMKNTESATLAIKNKTGA